MRHQGNRKEKNPDWQLTLKGNSLQISVDQPKGWPAPTRTNHKAPDWYTSLIGIEVKDKLRALDWSPTPVKIEYGTQRGPVVRAKYFGISHARGHRFRTAVSKA